MSDSTKMKLVAGGVTAAFIGINWALFKAFGPKVSIIYLPATLAAAGIVLFPDYLLGAGGSTLNSGATGTPKQQAAIWMNQ